MPVPRRPDGAAAVRDSRSFGLMVGIALLTLSTAAMPTALRAQVATAGPASNAEAAGATDGADPELPPDSLFWSAFEWRSIGPTNFGGRITDIEALPSPSKTIYVAAATGGIWKSINNGTTWRPVFDDQRVVAMGDIAIAPGDSSVVWAGTGEEDSRNSISPGGGVFKSADGGETWELMGLEDTQAIGRIVIHPEDPDVVYVAALGHIWGPNEQRGLYRTRDGGETWERIHHIDERTGFVDLAMHPGDPDVLFASSWQRVRGPWYLQSGGPGSALWRSEDGGDSWTEVTGGGFPEGLKGRIGIAIAPSAPEIVYALVEAGEPGDSLAHDVVEGPRAEAAEASAAEGATTEEPEAETAPEGAEEEEAEASAEDEPEGPSGLYRSEDGGRTWTLMNDENTRPFYYSQVRVDPSDPDRVYWSSTPVQFSKDGGKTVGQASLGIHVDHHAMWWDPADPERFIVGNDGGVHLTYDKGGTYVFVNTIPLGQFYAISLGNGIPYRVCGGLQDNGTWCGPSRLADDAITVHHWYTVNGGDGFYSTQDPQEPWIVYAESQGGNMARIDLRSGQREGLEPPDWKQATETLRDSVLALGGTLHGEVREEKGLLASDVRERLADLRRRISADSAALDLRFNWSTPFLLSPHDRETLYAGANRVLISTNRGDDWEVISPDLTYADSVEIRVSTETTGGITEDVTGAETHATITTLAESPLVEGRLLAGTDDGRVWIRRGPDAEWEELTDRIDGVPEGTWVSRIEPSHHDPERFYVAFDGHRSDDFRPYVQVTDDGGRSFRSIASDLPTGGPGYVHVIREDPRAPDLLFVGTDVGVYVSTDRGESWRPFMEGLPTVPVHDLRIHPRDRELVAGTHGRSFYIVDIAPLQDRIADRALEHRMAGSPVLFQPKPALQYGDPPAGGETPGHRWFRGESPRYGAEIAYWLPRDMGPGAAVASAGAEVEPPAVDLGGDWRVTVDGPMGAQTATLSLEMAEDGALSGTVESARGGGEVTDGRVVGRGFRAIVSTEMMGRSMEVTYAGEVAGEGDAARLTGSVSFGERFSAPFTGHPAGVEVAEQEAADAEGPETRARIAILDAAGDTVQTLDGPLDQGLHRVYWNLRSETKADSLSPSERADSIHTVTTIRTVVDSLVEAGEAERAAADRVLEMVTGGDRGAIFRLFGGGGGGRPDDSRPGESYPETAEEEPEAEADTEQAAAEATEAGEVAARGVEETEAEEAGEPEEGEEPDPGEIRDVMRSTFRALRDRGFGFSLFRDLNRTRPVEPGSYSVVVSVGEESLERPLEVVRAPGYVVPDPEDEGPSWEEIEELLREP